MVFQGALRAKAGLGPASLDDFCNPKATCEHDFEPSEPRAPCAWSPKLTASDRGWLRCSLAGGVANREVSGQGPRELTLRLSRGVLRCDRSQAKG